MIKVSKKLKYLFEEMPYMFYSDEYDESEVRVDKLVYTSFKFDTLKGLSEDDWELIHLDGDFKNNALDNLELVVFVEDDDMIKLQVEVKNLKQELIVKNEHIKTITMESKAKDGKVANMYKQVLYEQNRVKELNKEIRLKEKEIRRLFDITSAIHK